VTTNAETTPPSAQSINPPANTKTAPGQIVSGNSSAAVSAPTNPSVQNNSQPSPEMLRKQMESQNVPVEFYGEVIDQDGRSLSDATVRVKVRHWNVVTPVAFGAEGQMIPFEKQTGADGRFEITGPTGDAFDLESVEKDGYELDPSTKRGYGSLAGSFTDPIIFKMWSTNIHEQLITGKKSFPIIPDGRPYIIDLTKGTIAESGDGNLKVWVKRPAQVGFAQKFDWSCEVAPINGGILQEPDTSSSMYLAPTNGYKASFQYQQKVGSGWGDSTGTQRFYVMLDNNGHVFGQVSLELFAYYNDQTPGLIRIQYAVNPSGSRILR